jgi:hypothetical protein
MCAPPVEHRVREHGEPGLRPLTIGLLGARVSAGNKGGYRDDDYGSVADCHRSRFLRRVLRSPVGADTGNGFLAQKLDQSGLFLVAQFI